VDSITSDLRIPSSPLAANYHFCGFLNITVEKVAKTWKSLLYLADTHWLFFLNLKIYKQHLTSKWLQDEDWPLERSHITWWELQHSSLPCLGKAIRKYCELF
jgi:hypothetical protein